MGRFYSGDIEGKFWFGIQDSNDVENLVTITGNTEYSWHACNCVAEIEDDDYCRQCYGSKEEHIEAGTGFLSTFLDNSEHLDEILKI